MFDSFSLTAFISKGVRAWNDSWGAAFPWVQLFKGVGRKGTGSVYQFHVFLSY